MRLEFDPEVERPTQPVTVRLPRRLLQELRVLAKDRDVPYQSLMKVLLAEKVTTFTNGGLVAGLPAPPVLSLVWRAFWQLPGEPGAVQVPEPPAVKTLTVWLALNCSSE